MTWHSRISLDEASLHLFEQKAMAILNEHLLGVRLRAAGCRTIDVTWLSGLLARRRTRVIDWDTPWWRQLADRDRARGARGHRGAGRINKVESWRLHSTTR